MYLYKPQYKTRSGEYKSSRNWAVKYQEEGRQIVKSLGTPNKAAANARAKDLIQKANEIGWANLKPTLPGAKKTTIERLVGLYREFAQDKGLRERTVRLNTSSLKRISRDLKVKTIEDLNGQFRVWKKRKKIKAVTANGILRSVKSMFKEDCMDYYKEVGCPTINPFDKDRPTKAPEIKPFQGYPIKDIKILLTKAQKNLKANEPTAYALFLLALCGGLRQQEALWCKWENLTGNGILVESKEGEFETKSGKTRIVYLPDGVVKELKELRASEHPLIIAPNTVRIGTRKPQTRKLVAVDKLIEWLRSNGLNVMKPIHELRKIYGALMSTQHGLFAAKQMLGHSRVSVTEDYYAALLKQPVVTLEGISDA